MVQQLLLLLLNLIEARARFTETLVPDSVTGVEVLTKLVALVDGSDGGFVGDTVEVLSANALAVGFWISFGGCEAWERCLRADRQGSMICGVVSAVLGGIGQQC